ncbi:antA/AntB antirepressor family protein [uncultured Thiodictyon sp.]|uniref:antA/AntB antirepressor family protein n=1 Tax=uncultured Thiodictyon sp. TaxID=1846217 RepID=UPI0025F2208A|nr:antA/AntB antirepressor family protein [uncultured Thiodictyon sp.]
MSDPTQDPSAPVPSVGTQLVPVFHGEIGGVPAQVCDARTLHAFLQNGDLFANWIKDRITKYDFQENQDFAIALEIAKAKRGGQNRKDYHLSLDMAKELSMVENNAKGREARRYFIAMERQALAALEAAAAAPPTPDPDDAPPIGLGDLVIRQDPDGRYCLDDLYRAAGAAAKHPPERWLQREETQEQAQRYKVPGRPPIVVTPHGTFIEYGLVLAYGHSVGQDFHRQVSDAFVSAAAIRSNIWMPRMVELRRLMEQPDPAALLLPGEQQFLAAVIGARCEGLDAPLQEQVSAQLWSSLQRQFQIVEPAELLRSQLADAILYLSALPVASVPALPAPAAPVEVLTRDDLANLDRVLGLMTDHQFRARAWRFAIWRSLRAVTGTAAPQPFEVRHLPAMCSELRRIYAASAAWEEAVYKAEADLLRRVFRDGEDFEQVIAEQRDQQLAAGVERGAQLILELSHGRMAEISKLYARVPAARCDPRPDLRE